MSELEKVAASIAARTADYRLGEIAAPTADHVSQWVEQFPSGVRFDLLHELDAVFEQTYYSLGDVRTFLDTCVRSRNIAGEVPKDFWPSVRFLDIQQDGESQSELLIEFDGRMRAQLGLGVEDCDGSGEAFVYIDDVIFSGNRVGSDLSAWVLDGAPQRGVVHVITIAVHTLGMYFAQKRVEEAAKTAGKAIKFKFWALRKYETRKANRNSSEVLWPTEVPDHPAVAAYLAREFKFPLEPRTPGGPLGVFSSEDRRLLLERELVIAGARILEGYASPGANMRPLGFSPFGLGFGSLVITYRNCPNNVPLALWWGLEQRRRGGWYPLFPRKTYS